MFPRCPREHKGKKSNSNSEFLSSEMQETQFPPSYLELFFILFTSAYKRLLTVNKRQHHRNLEEKITGMNQVWLWVHIAGLDGAVNPSAGQDFLIKNCKSPLNWNKQFLITLSMCNNCKLWANKKHKQHFEGIHVRPLHQSAIRIHAVRIITRKRKQSSL